MVNYSVLLKNTRNLAKLFIAIIYTRTNVNVTFIKSSNGLSFLSALILRRVPSQLFKMNSANCEDSNWFLMEPLIFASETHASIRLFYVRKCSAIHSRIRSLWSAISNEKLPKLPSIYSLMPKNTSKHQAF